MKNIAAALAFIDEQKKKIDAMRPLPPALVRNLQEWLSIEFIYTSNALEGNTLLFGETAIVVEKGIAIGGKTVREHLEVIDCARTVNFITARARNKQSITLDDICTIYTSVAQKTDVSLDLIDFMSWLHTATDHPVIIAALAHYKLVTIHPFVDGDACHSKLQRSMGRTARLLMNLLLLQHGYPLAIIKKEQRPEYIAAIENAQQTDDFNAFYAVIISAVEYSLDIYLESIEQSDLS